MKIKPDFNRLQSRLKALSTIGATAEGGVRRLALTQKDAEARRLIIQWMEEAGMNVQIDRIGNIFGSLGDPVEKSPVMTGSHIDTVGNGGNLDGMYGVVAGLEIAETIKQSNLQINRPYTVAVFTNEEGVRFQPDMMGSLVHAGGMDIDQALDSIGTDGVRLGDALEDIKFNGTMPVGAIRPFRFLELHIEQGPVLEAKGITIGAVENLQGIYWSKINLCGQANHAGTTPLELRRDSGLAAAEMIVAARNLSEKMNDGQVATVGSIEFTPNLVNVVPSNTSFTLDLRNPDKARLQEAQENLETLFGKIAHRHQLDYKLESLVRFDPVTFDGSMVEIIEITARRLGHSVIRMTSGAGHDAQMMSRIAPTAMIFVPSRKGISHNPAEYTDPAHLKAGLDVLAGALENWLFE